MTDEVTKKEKQSKIKATAKFLFDVPAWIGTNNLSQSTGWLSRLIQQTFRISSRPSDTQKETFDDAMQRMGITTEELPKRAGHFLLVSIMFLVLSIGSLAYMSYLWARASWLVIIATFIVFCLFSVRAYFYSFWCFQIRKKRLDCTFKEWLVWLFKGGL